MMALKDIYKVMSTSGIVIPVLDQYLLSLNSEDNDRALDVNAPSQIGTCLRSRYYARTKTEGDPFSINARLRRIFDNGTKVHDRLQDYLLKQGMLLVDEVPVLHPDLKIQGHTDGILDLTSYNDTHEFAILEIKSMNSNLFNKLEEAKPEHIMQGLTYVFSVESRRQVLHKKYSTFAKFKLSKKSRMKYYASFYQHLKGGNKFTKEEKIQYQCNLHDYIDTLLMKQDIPITKALFLYESKDTQDMKEFLISTENKENLDILDTIISECEELNECVENEEVPPRGADKKSDNLCRFCKYKIACWN